MQTRANTKAVNHWFLMLFIVLIFLYFIGCVLGLGTKSCKFSTCGSFFFVSALAIDSFTGINYCCLIILSNVASLFPFTLHLFA